MAFVFCLFSPGMGMDTGPFIPILLMQLLVTVKSLKVPAWTQTEPQLVLMETAFTKWHTAPRKMATGK